MIMKNVFVMAASLAMLTSGCFNGASLKQMAEDAVQEAAENAAKEAFSNETAADPSVGEQQTDEQLSASADADNVSAKPKTNFPWDFPEGNKNPQLTEGQAVLSIHSFYPTKLKESKKPADETYIFYNASLKTIGDTKSLVAGVFEEVEMPNALIIPLPQGQTVKKGDIVLTWWQSGSGMERAIVTDASNPASPKVCYLDMNYKDDGTGFANQHANEQLKPNTFTKLNDGEWQPGADVMVTADGSYKIYTLINMTDDKLLVDGWAGKISVVRRADCQLVPLSQDFKVGDEVMANFAGHFSTGYTVTKVDKKIGRVWLKDSYGETKAYSILEVLKNW